MGGEACSVTDEIVLAIARTPQQSFLRINGVCRSRFKTYVQQLRNATYPTELYVKSHHGGESVGPTYVGTVGTYVIG
uniref:Uncharacterized protein n=1 Tax=Vespula pensylvanica TaxID=30213 RepID=A0A834K1F7_VESPE|nr:hypothetical protein H0235_016391 [Vespula pensylvanica]